MAVGRYLNKITDKPKPADSSHRLIGLDVLRFLAVTLVLHIHALQGFGPSPAGTALGIPGRILDLIPPGMHGVDIFFVLSGFLVSGLFFQELARTGTVSAGRFLVRRGFKIYPAFWLLILVTVLVQWLQTGRVNSKGLLAELLFFQNYVVGLWDHTWTLAIEEHFYFLLAAIFFVLKRFPDASGRITLKAIPRVVDVVILSCLAARVLTWWFSEKISIANPRWLGSVTHVRIDALFFGVWLAHGWHNCWSDARKARLLSFRYLWVALGFVLISPLSEYLLDVESWRVFGVMVVYVGAGCLLMAALSLDPFRCPGWVGGFAWLGRHSYSVYLWHMLVLAWMPPLLGTRSSGIGVFLIKELIYVASSWIFGIIMARLIEIPMLRLRDRVFPERPKA